MPYVLEKGRPDDLSGRLPREIACYDLLDSLGIEYYRTDHPDAAAYTMEACREIDAVLGTEVCKNLFLTNRRHTAFYLLIMPGDKVFKTKEITGQLGCARLSFGSPEEMEALIGCAPGSSSLLGLMNDRDKQVQLVIDRDVLSSEYFGCHPCINTSSLKMKTSDAFGAFLKAVRHDYIPVTLIGDQ
ncbi:MAG: prolyl-tRNA synthetase associated domain-containing protein [Lachnospiraceae bacterium]|nr:prolyl-tRNA synthetase associated domain-containing protein [Lachnospiraceae bacterium]